MIQFFSFRKFYESSKDNWQRMQWSRRAKRWELLEDFYSFSLSDSLTLVERRIHLPINQMIEDEWLHDWRNLNTSFLYVNDCLRFCNFALYRSKLRHGEDWQRRPDLGFDFESEMLLRTRNDGIRKFMPGRATAYDRSEPTSSFDSDAWLEQLNLRNAIDHDNLGIDRSIGGF